ncbi:hypothetical protein EYF80_010065 [Liparis tanakae]|uniref:Uncharacterized protein n=1 Tax=Liparis tanakae TaxID=230148 RepID=A0A4Z2IPE1_9TELE|nr:hypothetical protein EYF80_010065 [Liparis tanakae]
METGPRVFKAADVLVLPFALWTLTRADLTCEPSCEPKPVKETLRLLLCLRLFVGNKTCWRPELHEIRTRETRDPEEDIREPRRALLQGPGCDLDLKVKRYPKVLCSLGQFLCKLLSLVQRLLVRVVQRRLLGGHGQLLQESTQVVALAQEALGGLSPLGLPVQGVHQPLAHHDHQLTLRDELLRRLAVPKAAHKSIDGLLESAEVKPAVLRHGGGSLLLWAAAGLGGVTLVTSLRSGDMEQRASLPSLFASIWTFLRLWLTDGVEGLRSFLWGSEQKLAIGIDDGHQAFDVLWNGPRHHDEAVQLVRGLDMPRVLAERVEGPPSHVQSTHCLL